VINEDHKASCWMNVKALMDAQAAVEDAGAAEGGEA
jgi:hypothetical protein